jgi:hypothetical protein
MKTNMGSTDKLFRVLAAALIVVLYVAGVISGTMALVLGVLAVVFLLTSMLGFCPLYVPFKFSSKKKAG